LKSQVSVDFKVPITKTHKPKAPQIDTETGEILTFSSKSEGFTLERQEKIESVQFDPYAQNLLVLSGERTTFKIEYDKLEDAKALKKQLEEASDATRVLKINLKMVQELVVGEATPPNPPGYGGSPEVIEYSDGYSEDLTGFTFSSKKAAIELTTTP